MKVEGGGHYLRAVNDGAGMVAWLCPAHYRNPWISASPCLMDPSAGV